MKKYYTSSDCGAIMLGTHEFAALFSNGYGDRTTTVYVVEKEEPSPSNSKDWKFIDCVEGTFNLYEDDCCHNRTDSDVVASFCGRYGVYYNDNGNGECLIEQWEDWSNKE